MRSYYAIQSCICCTFQFPNKLGVRKASNLPRCFPELSGCPRCGSTCVVITQKLDEATAQLLIRLGNQPPKLSPFS